MENTIKRDHSVDIYRGFVMFLMMAEVLEFSKVSKAIPQSGFWKFLAFNQSHVEWVGCSLHDMIQPSFTFLVGVALPYSIAARLSNGANFKLLLMHTIKRSLILVFLGVFLRSIDKQMTNWTFEDTLSQIGLGYTFLFLIGFLKPKKQWISLAMILFGYWLAFAVFPLNPQKADFYLLGNNPDWQHNILSGFAAHWNKNTNLAWAFDSWFLNLFPREKPFVFNGGGYVTLSFIPTLGTMILGLFAGNILKSHKTNQEKLKTFLIYGLTLIGIGILLNLTGICPNVKRIWTPTWVLFSGGCCFVLLSIFYFLVEIKNNGKRFEFLRIIGINSIAAYVIAHTLVYFIADSLPVHLGHNFAKIFGEQYEHLVNGGLVLFLEWLVLLWMFRKKIFIKI
jgi:predicted acyltransferase